MDHIQANNKFLIFKNPKLLVLGFYNFIAVVFLTSSIANVL